MSVQFIQKHAKIEQVRNGLHLTSLLFSILLLPIFPYFFEHREWKNHSSGISDLNLEGGPCLRILESLVPPLEWLELAVPPRFLNPIVPAYRGGPIIDPASYYRLGLTNSKGYQPLSVVVVQLEALRYDIVDKSIDGLPISPFINELARDSIVFTRAYANSSHTNYSVLCAPLGLYPLRSRYAYIYDVNDPQPHFMLHDILKPFGYQTMFLSSQYEPWCGMDQYWKTASLDWYVDSTNSWTVMEGKKIDSILTPRALAGNVDDSVTVDEFIRTISKRLNRNRPFVAFVSFESAHFPYTLPSGYRGPFQPGVIDFPASFLSVPQEHIGEFKNAYWNAVAYMDSQLKRLYRGLEELALADHTIFVVLADHGEDLCDTGFPTHGMELTDPVTHIPLLIRDKRFGRKTSDVPVSQADVAPTILGLLGLMPFPGHQGVDVLNSDRDYLFRRPIFLHADGFCRQDGIIAWPWKLLVDIDTGVVKLFNLEKGEITAGELHEAFPEIVEPLAEHLLAFRKGQLSYYSHVELYGKYFPPIPPVLKAIW